MTGTGNLLLLAARAVPDATVIGLDPDPRVLAIAARKARRAGVTLRLDRGYADRLPYPDGSVDRVLSAFMLHHLPADQQHDALREVRRVLGAGRPPAPARHRRQRRRRRPAGCCGSATCTRAEHGTAPGTTGTGRARTRMPTPTPRSPRFEKAGLADAAVVAHGAMPLGGFSFYRAAR